MNIYSYKRCLPAGATILPRRPREKENLTIAENTQSRSLLYSKIIAPGSGEWDALRGHVYWLVEPLYGNRLPRRIQSTHHLGAEALAKTHSLYGIKLNDEASTI
jgi:hypothetical protein